MLVSLLTTPPHLSTSRSRDAKVDAYANASLVADTSASADIDLKALLGTYVGDIAQQQLDEMHFSASREAVHALEEAADDLKADLRGTIDEGVAELQNVSEASLNDLQETAAVVITQMRETLEGHADEVYTEVFDDVSGLATIKGYFHEKMGRRIRMMIKQASVKNRGHRVSSDPPREQSGKEDKAVVTLPQEDS